MRMRIGLSQICSFVIVPLGNNLFVDRKKTFTKVTALLLLPHTRSPSLSVHRFVAFRESPLTSVTLRCT